MFLAREVFLPILPSRQTALIYSLCVFRAAEYVDLCVFRAEYVDSILYAFTVGGADTRNTAPDNEAAVLTFGMMISNRLA